MSRISTLSSDITGQRFETRQGDKFKVLEGQFFPQKRIALQHQDYLGGLRTGLLVSVFFHGQPVPLVTVDGGVVRLVSVKRGDEEAKGSRRISRLLGISQTREPRALYLK